MISSLSAVENSVRASVDELNQLVKTMPNPVDGPYTMQLTGVSMKLIMLQAALVFESEASAQINDLVQLIHDALRAAASKVAAVTDEHPHHAPPPSYLLH